MPELVSYLQPKQKEFRKAINTWPVVLFGGGRGGGKSHGLRNIHMIRRFEYPASTGVIFRKSYPELEANHIAPLFKQFPALKEYYNESKKVLTLPNGSVEQFCHCGSMRDVHLYQGREYHDFAYEEAGEITEDVFQALRASNRTSNPNIPARAQITANPGGVGHQWLKRLFITKRYKPHEKPTDYYFIKSLLKDNQALMQADPDYRDRLLAQCNETLRRAWLEGDWDIEAGQFFTDLDRDIHAVKPFTIPKHWKWFVSYDYGFNHPTCWHFFVGDEDGNCYLVHEIVRAQMGIDEQAQLVNEFDKRMVDSGQKERREVVAEAGHDCWARKKGSDPTIAEDFIKHGIILRRANIDRKLGAHQVRMYLQHKTNEDGKRVGPRVFIFDTCEITLDCLFRMTHNPNDLEDVLKVDAVEGDPWTGDDPYDCFRYGLTSRPSISIAPPKRRHTTYDGETTRTTSWQTV